MSAALESIKLFSVALVLVFESLVRLGLTTFYKFFPFPRLLDLFYLHFAFLRNAFSRRLEGPQEHPELNYHFAELVSSQGYDVEEHFAETEDGFFLVLHRVKARRKTNENNSSYGTPVLLMHGLMMSSEVFVIQRNVSLAFELVDRGYDVWLGNNRGNKYSWMHRKYKRDSEKYWDYSIDELAHHDIPTSVHYILKITGYSKLAYLGFSNGTSQMFAALAMDPALQKFVSLFVALAPACKLKTLRPGAESFNLFYTLLTSSPSVFRRIFGRRAMLGVADAWKSILSAAAFTRMIDFFLWHLFGWCPNDVDPKVRELFYFHIYSTMSTKVVQHWFQMLRSGSFEFYDDATVAGAAGTVVVPEYTVESISTRIVLIHGGKDHLSDIRWLRQKLGKFCVAAHEIPEYEHVDFLFRRSVSQQVFPLVLKYLEKRGAPKEGARPPLERGSEKNLHPLRRQTAPASQSVQLPTPIS